MRITKWRGPDRDRELGQRLYTSIQVRFITETDKCNNCLWYKWDFIFQILPFSFFPDNSSEDGLLFITGCKLINITLFRALSTTLYKKIIRTLNETKKKTFTKTPFPFENKLFSILWCKTQITFPCCTTYSVIMNAIRHNTDLAPSDAGSGVKSSVTQHLSSTVIYVRFFMFFWKR